MNCIFRPAGKKAPQVGGVQLLDDRRRLEAAHALELGVAADRPVLGQLGQVALVGAGEDDHVTHRGAP
jgi:hypothetical protein